MIVAFSPVSKLAGIAASQVANDPIQHRFHVRKLRADNA
jgi:hypothetical protein